MAEYIKIDADTVDELVPSIRLKREAIQREIDSLTEQIAEWQAVVDNYKKALTVMNTK